MPLPTFSPSPGPSPGTSTKPEIKILEAEFGDGYSQPTPDGLNHIRDVVELAWDGLTDSEMTAIYGFFRARGGTQPFYFRPIGEPAPLKWTCKEFARNKSQGVWKVSATLRQSFTNLA